MINLGFWEKLKKPIFCMAPMACVTDCAFRKIITKYGKPDIFWTEFVSADGLAHPKAREKLLIDLKFSKNEKPIVAQIFGANSENIKKASAFCRKLGFDGIDINMGCPDKSVEKQRAGAALIKNPKLAREIIRAAKEGWGEVGSRKGEESPVSVKTRIGYSLPAGEAGKNEMEKWIKNLLEEDIAALTVHLRARKEMSNVPAHWDLMKKIVEIRNEMKKKTLVIGNGDVANLQDAREKIKESGCDGVMFGRAIFGNPWLFAWKQKVSLPEKLHVMAEHAKLFEKMFVQRKSFAVMKKHFKAYANGFRGAKDLRIKLMETENATQLENIVKKFLK